MAIQAQLYPDNLGLPLMGGLSQDCFFMPNNNQCNHPHNTTNNNTVDVFVNGCGFNEIDSNNLQQQQYLFLQHQQQQQQALLQLQQQYLLKLQNQQQQRIFCKDNNNNNNNGSVFLSSSKNCTPSTTASTTTTTESDYQMPMNGFDDQLEKQRLEIDRFITLQSERLKIALQEQRKQQLGRMMRKLEWKAMQILKQKEEEIAKGAKKRMELEVVVQKLEAENQEWQRLATENEAMVASLSNTLEQIKEQACCVTSSCSSNDVGDAESCCNVNNTSNTGNGCDDDKNSRKRRRSETGETCKVCKTGKSCVLLLPCRHLSCCKGCEAFVDVCPVCKSAKMASIEALFS